MTEVGKLLHADIQARTYSDEVEETAERLTALHLARGASGGWNHKVEARCMDTTPADAASVEVSAEGSDFATPDAAIAAAGAGAVAQPAGGVRTHGPAFVTALLLPATRASRAQEKRTWQELPSP